MNPLDHLPFNINSLRAYNEFNWDCIDGIDQVHKDILKVYERAILSMVNPLAGVHNSITQVGQSISDYAAAGIPTVQQAIKTIDDGISARLNQALAPLSTRYGGVGSTPSLWIVYRQIACNDWIPFIESWVSPPSDRTSYGPYDNDCVLSLALNDTNVTSLPVGAQAMPAWSQLTYDQINAAYALANQGLCEGDPHNLYPYQQDRETQEVAQDQCNQQGDGNGQDTQPPTYINGASLQCSEFTGYVWTNEGQLPKWAADMGYTVSDGPFYTSPNSYFLTGLEYQTLYQQCNPIPPPACCPPPVINCPNPIVNVYNQIDGNTLTQTQNQTQTQTQQQQQQQQQQQGQTTISQLSTQQCCNQIVQAINNLTIAMGGQPSQVGANEDVAIATGLSDDAFQLSKSFVSFADDYFDELRTVFAIPVPFSSIVNKIKHDMLQEQSTEPFEPDQTLPKD